MQDYRLLAYPTAFSGCQPAELLAIGPEGTNVLGIVHFCDAGVIGVGIGNDEKLRLSAEATKVAQDDVPSDVFVRSRDDMELTVLGFQAQPGNLGRAARA